MKINLQKGINGFMIIAGLLTVSACSEYPLVNHTEMKANKASTLSEVLSTNVEVSEYKSDNPKLKLHHSTVYFGSDDYTLDKKDLEQLEGIVNYLEELNDYEIIVETHTDKSGDADENKILSNQRGDSIYMYLISNSIPAHKIIMKSMGWDKPAVYGDSDYSRSMNRRAEIKVIPKL